MSASDVQDVCAGEPREVAVPKLIERWGGEIYALALRLCNRRHDAEDVAQEVFLQAHRKWRQFRGQASPRTWLYTIAVRACRRMQRRRAGQPRRMASLDELLPLEAAQLATPPRSADGLSQAERDESVAALERAIAALPPAYRMPIVLKDIVGLPIHEVGAVLGLKQNTVKARVHRARLRLRESVVRGLPRAALAPPAYPVQVCLDLLRAKQEALDHGTTLPDADKLICQRCRAVFASLDLTQDLCRDLAAGKLPGDVRKRLEQQLGAATDGR